MKTDHVRETVRAVLKGNVKSVILLAFAVAGSVAFGLIPPQILKLVIDRNLVPAVSAGLLRCGVLYLCVALAIGGFDFLKGVVLTVIGQKLTRRIRAEMMRKTARLDALYFTENGTGAVVSRFTNDVEAINAMFSNGIVGMMIDCLKIVGIVVSMWLFDATLGLIATALLPLIYLITRFFQKRMLAAQIENRRQIGRVNDHLTESLKNVEMVKTGGKEGYMEDRFGGLLSDNYRTVEKVNLYDSLFPPVIQITRAILIGLVVTLASPDLALLGITIGMAAAAVDLLSDLFAPIENLGVELQNVQQSVAGIRRVNAFLDEPEEAPREAGLRASDVIPDRRTAGIAFDDVSFRYQSGADVLSHIDLAVQPGEKVTFVGRTGVGKTTLFKLCIGLLKPVTGKILVNGVDVCRIPHAEKRRIFGYVDQTFHLVKGTVADQIGLLDDAISRADVERAVAFVGMSDAVAALPQGLDTPVVNDTLFSQGQKQLLAIARAIVTDPPILVLDEITANLDAITEAKIVAVLRQAGSARTILSISHRLSSIVACDTIVILENGAIKNSGSPAELMKNDDWYKSRIALEKLTWN